MNLYTTPAAIKTYAGLDSTATDAILLPIIEGISRTIDDETNRYFHTTEETKLIEIKYPQFLFVPDLLRVDSIAALGSTGGDETDLIVANYVLHPTIKFPKVQIKGQPLNNHGFLGMVFVNITGLWGYGDGYGASPFATSLANIDSLSSSATSKVIEPSTDYLSGQTYMLTTDGNTEQIYITNVDSETNTVTFERGVNGTTAIEHTAATVQRSKYPAYIVSLVQHAATRVYALRARAGIKVDKLDTMSHTFDDGVSMSMEELKSLKNSGFIRKRF